MLALALVACVEGEGEAGSRDWHGAYRWGHEVNSFCPCGTGKCYWVRAETGVRAQLRAYVEQQSRKPYQPVYLQLRGRLLDEPRQGFASVLRQGCIDGFSWSVSVQGQARLAANGHSPLQEA